MKRPPKIITLFIHYLVFHCESQDGKKILLRKRIGSGIWKNLYDFPSLEAPHSLAFGEIEIHPDFLQLLPHGPVRVAEVKEKYRHLLSHRELQVRFFLIELSGETEVVMADHYRWAGEKDLDNLPFPRLISRFLEKHPLF
jgi:A/G-specific adenine glycosylase